MLSLLLHRGTLRCTPSNLPLPFHPWHPQLPSLTLTQPISPSSPKSKGSRGDARREGSPQHPPPYPWNQQ